LVFEAIMTIPQPTAFSALIKGARASARAAGGDSPTPADEADVTCAGWQKETFLGCRSSLVACRHR